MYKAVFNQSRTHNTPIPRISILERGLSEIDANYSHGQRIPHICSENYRKFNSKGTHKLIEVTRAY